MSPRPPRTATVDVVDDLHGHRVADPYRWLEDLDADEVAEWVAAQNAHTEEWFAAAGDLTGRLRDRLTALIDRPRRSAPSRRGQRWFWLANDGLADQDVLVTAAAPDDPAPRVLIDPNAMSDDGTVALAGAAASPDGERLAYALSEAGSDWMTWHVLDVAAGATRSDRVAWAKFAGAAWAPDGSGFFYGRFEEPAAGDAHEATNRGHEIRFHRLGTDQGDDVLVHHAPDEPSLVFSPHVSDDGRWLIVSGSPGTERTSGVWVADLAAVSDPAAVRPQPLLVDFDALYGVVDTEGDTVVVVTDAGAPRRRVIAVDARAPSRERWVELVAEDPVDTLDRVVRVGDRLICGWLHHARSRLSVHGLDGAACGDIALPELGSVGAITGRRDDAAAYLEFTGFTRPMSLHRHDLATGATSRVWQPDLAFDPDAFVTEQVFVESSDGAAVPAFVVRRADCELDAGGQPTLLWGYGGFAIPVTPMFRAWWLAWVERGGVLVVANLRGGGEYGAAWHDAGRLERKQQVFDDALAVADWLVARGWTTPARLAINGGSNGGLLVGACLTQRPEAFGAAVAEVGVLDLLRFHRFTIGWAWASDYGTADDPEQLGWLLSYSPLHNVRSDVCYPPTLITTGDTDDRVVPAHSYKFAAALQAAGAEAGCGGPVLLRVETRAGHGMGKPLRVTIDERAAVLAFLWRTVGAERAGVPS